MLRDVHTLPCHYGPPRRPLRSAPQEQNRYRLWAVCPELGGRYLRVVTLVDEVTIRNAFLDRGVRTVKLNHHADTDFLYIDLSEQPGSDSRGGTGRRYGNAV